MGHWIKRILLLFSVSMASSLLSAHEFWLHPGRFIYQPGETINIRFEVGEHFKGENWTGNANRVRSLQLYMSDTQDDLADHLGEEKGDSLQLAMFDEGTAMVTFSSTNSFIEMEGQKFNEYLKDEGLANALEQRQQQQLQNKPGRELYQRSVKTLIQVGSKTNNCYRRLTDLPLDIIPQINPYDLKNNQQLTAKIFFNRKVLANYDVMVWHRVANITQEQRLKTNAKGEIIFDVNTNGSWMISAVRMIPLTGNPAADWQSYWGSVTWGY